MAAAAPPPPNLDVEARQAVARACDALITRQQLFAIFDEKVGAADYARWRKDLIAFVASAGQDFVKALLFVGVIPAPPQYADAQVTMDTAAGRPQLTMPQMRQQAMLTVIRSTLQPGGESLRLIAQCVHGRSCGRHDCRARGCPTRPSAETARHQVALCRHPGV